MFGVVATVKLLFIRDILDQNKIYRRKQGIPVIANFKDVESPSISLLITVQRHHACRIQTVQGRRFTAVKSVCPCGLRVGNERIILPT